MHRFHIVAAAVVQWSSNKRTTLNHRLAIILGAQWLYHRDIFCVSAVSIALGLCSSAFSFLLLFHFSSFEVRKTNGSEGQPGNSFMLPKVSRSPQTYLLFLFFESNKQQRISEHTGVLQLFSLVCHDYVQNTTTAFAIATSSPSTSFSMNLPILLSLALVLLLFLSRIPYHLALPLLLPDHCMLKCFKLLWIIQQFNTSH